MDMRLSLSLPVVLLHASIACANAQAPGLVAETNAPMTESTSDNEMKTRAASELERLNAAYVRAYLESDVSWFERHLAKDFRCILSSGALIDREEFLRNVARPVAMASFDVEDVVVRFVDGVAIVQARTQYETSEGKRGGSRYVDLWVLRDGRWQTLLAQITAISTPASAP